MSHSGREVVFGRYSVKKVFLKVLHLCQSLSFNKKEDGINEIIIAIKRETNTCSFGYVYGLMYQELRQMVVTTDRKNVRLVSKAL